MQHSVILLAVSAVCLTSLSPSKCQAIKQQKERERKKKTTTQWHLFIHILLGVTRAKKVLSHLLFLPNVSALRNSFLSSDKWDDSVDGDICQQITMLKSPANHPPTPSDPSQNHKKKLLSIRQHVVLFGLYQIF